MNNSKNIYIDGITTQMGPFGMTLIATRSKPNINANGEITSTNSEEQVRLNMSPQLVKALLILLDKNMQNYEANYGEIQAVLNAQNNNNIA